MKISLLLTLLVTAWLYTGAQGLQVGSSPAVPHYGRGAAAWSDYDGDGDADLLLCGLDSAGLRHTVLLQNNGTTLAAASQAFAQVSDGDAAFGDMDGDGDPDLVLTGEVGPRQSVTVIYQNQAGLLTPLNTPSIPGLSMGRAVWSDFDHDGDKDIFLTGFSETEGFVGMIARNDGNGVFAAVRNSLYTTQEWTAAAVGDYDLDGMPDIAFADKSSLITEGMRARVLRNLGGMQFAVASSAMPGFYGGSLGFADWDGDQDLDLLCAGMNRAPVTEVYKNVGGQFVSANAGMTPTGGGEAVWSDFDHDGDPDVLVAGRTATGLEMRVWRNNSGAFTLLQSPATLPALANARIAVADWNGDGYADFVVTGSEANDIPRAYIGTWFNNLQQFKF